MKQSDSTWNVANAEGIYLGNDTHSSGFRYYLIPPRNLVDPLNIGVINPTSGLLSANIRISPREIPEENFKVSSSAFFIDTDFPGQVIFPQQNTAYMYASSASNPTSMWHHTPSEIDVTPENPPSQPHHSPSRIPSSIANSLEGGFAWDGHHCGLLQNLNGNQYNILWEDFSVETLPLSTLLQNYSISTRQLPVEEESKENRKEKRKENQKEQQAIDLSHVASEDVEENPKRKRRKIIWKDQAPPRQPRQPDPEEAETKSNEETDEQNSKEKEKVNEFNEFHLVVNEGPNYRPQFDVNDEMRELSKEYNEDEGTLIYRSPHVPRTREEKEERFLELFQGADSAPENQKEKGNVEEDETQEEGTKTNRDEFNMELIKERGI